MSDFIRVPSIVQIVPDDETGEYHVVSFHMASGMDGYTHVWRFKSPEELLEKLGEWYA